MFMLYNLDEFKDEQINMTDVLNVTAHEPQCHKLGLNQYQELLWTSVAELPGN